MELDLGLSPYTKTNSKLINVFHVKHVGENTGGTLPDVGIGEGLSESESICPRIKAKN